MSNQFQVNALKFINRFQIFPARRLINYYQTNRQFQANFNKFYYYYLINETVIIILFLLIITNLLLDLFGLGDISLLKIELFITLTIAIIIYFISMILHLLASIFIMIKELQLGAETSV